jgi:hypothetical protein
MFHLHAIRRLGSAALRWLRQPALSPSCTRPSLELLPDRILPSTDVVSPVRPDYSLELAEPEIERMRFMEIPKSGAVLRYWESDAFSLSAKEVFDIIGGPSLAEQFDMPVLTPGTVQIEGKSFATLELGFGTSVTACFVFAGDEAGSAGNAESAPYLRPNLLGGLLELHADGGERRFLMDYRGPEKAELGAPLHFGLLSAEYTGDSKAIQPWRGGRPAVGGPEPTEALPVWATTGPPLALFIAGWPGGTQIAGGLSTPSADDAGLNAMAEAAFHAPGNPADVLLTVDTVLPDARADLVRLQNADLAIVPTYVAGAAPATPLAPPRVDDRPDLGLAAQVVGLDEFPTDGSLMPASTDRLFEQLAWAGGGGGLATGGVDLRGMQLGAIDGGDAAQAAAEARHSAVPTDAAPAVREWLDVLLQRVEKGAVMVPVLALEGLMAFVYWRGLRADRQRDRPK